VEKHWRKRSSFKEVQRVLDAALVCKKAKQLNFGPRDFIGPAQYFLIYFCIGYKGFSVHGEKIGPVL
jgi:hypothetical protein